MGRKLGKIIFFVGLILIVLTLIVRSVVYRGIRVALVVYSMDLAYGLVLIGAFLWLVGHSDKKVEKVEKNEG